MAAPSVVDVPASVWRGACLAWRRREVGTEVALEVRLLHEHDSFGQRHLRFTTDAMRLDLVVRRSSEAVILCVVVRPRGRRNIVLRHGGPDVTTSTDRFGRATFDNVVPGPVSLLLRKNAVQAATSWTIL